MIRRVFLAFFVFGLVACGDGIVTLEDIVGTYTLQTVNGEELGFAFQTFNPDGTQSITLVNGAQAVLGPESSCDVGVTSMISVFDQFGFFVGVTTTTSTDPCTFDFSNPVITLNYPDGRVETGSVVGSTLTLNRGDQVWVFRK